MDRERLEHQLGVEEGRRNDAYLDSLGFLTVGIGHNCVAKPVPGVSKVGDRITDDVLDGLFFDDVNDSVVDLDSHLPWWKSLDDVRQNVLVDMAFNMGIKTLCTFHNTLQAVEEGRYADAARGMKNSLWARQVGKRALRLAKMMETGEWADDL